MLKKFSAPLSSYLCVTNACNLTCVYCSAESGEKYANELSTEEWLRVIDELDACNVFETTITGGEPFIRKDLPILLRYLAEKRIATSLISNGTLINDDSAKLLIEVGISEVRISLDSISEELNDSARGRAAFRRAWRGIETLIRFGIRPAILATVTRQSFPFVMEMVEEVSRLGVMNVAFNLVSAVGRGGCTYPTVSLSTDDIHAFSENVRAAQSQYGSSFVKEDVLHWYTLPERRDKFLGMLEAGETAKGKTMLPCGAAKTACSITADGWVIPCNKFTGYRCGSLREDSFINIWNGQMMNRLRSLATKPTSESTGCSSCGYNGVCAGGCRAEAFLHFGDIEAPDPGCAVLPDSAVHHFRSHHEALIQISGVA